MSAKHRCFECKTYMLFSGWVCRCLYLIIYILARYELSWRTLNVTAARQIASTAFLKCHSGPRSERTAVPPYCHSGLDPESHPPLGTFFLIVQSVRMRSRVGARDDMTAGRRCFSCRFVGKTLCFGRKNCLLGETWQFLRAFLLRVMKTYIPLPPIPWRVVARIRCGIDDIL